MKRKGGAPKRLIPENTLIILLAPHPVLENPANPSRDWATHQISASGMATSIQELLPRLPLPAPSCDWPGVGPTFSTYHFEGPIGFTH